MIEKNGTIPAALQEIVEEFGEAENQEKLELLLEFSDELPELPDWLEGRHDEMDQVHECMTPLFVFARSENGGLNFYFDVPSNAPTVRGFAEILREGLANASPEEILQIPQSFYIDMGLQKVLTPQRLNGMDALLAHIKRLATAELAH